MNHLETKSTTLVLGGTGKTGSRIVSRLQQLNWPVRIGSRSAAIPFDWENDASWKPALTDVEAVYISYHPDLSLPAAVPAIRAFSSLAVDCGISKLVLLSGRGEPEAQECERIVMNSGTDWTIIRASWFFQNFSESHLLEPIVAGFVSLPAGNVPEPFIDADDIADIAVEALTTNAHARNLYEVTGPRLLSFREAVAEIAQAAGRTIAFEDVSVEQYVSMLKMYGVPEVYVRLLEYLFTELLDGRNAYTTDAVELVLKRKPRDFSDFAREVAASGIWAEVKAS